MANKSHDFIVYKAEKEAGLADAIRNGGTITFASLVEPLSPTDKYVLDLEKIKSSLVKAQETDFDLYPLKTVLVSTGWNRNDDVFTHDEIWAARNTPEDKPFNFEHNDSDIIGHITENFCVDADFVLIANDCSIDDLPEKFHIVTSAVLYRYWSDEERQERMDKVIAEIGEGKWFVSMEARFKGFDYAVVDEEGNHKVLARNKDTSFLTKHLRAYGGTGEYDGYKVGRMIKNLTFAGKGLVRRPANPDSVILGSMTNFTGDKTKVLASFKDCGVYISDNEDKSNAKETAMTIEQLTKELAEAKATIDSLTKANEEAKTGAEKVKAELATVHSAKQEVELAKTAAEKARDDAEKAKAELETNLTKTQAELAELNLKMVTAARVQALVNKGLSTEDATAKAAAFSKIDDAAFEAIVSMITVAPPAKSKEEVEAEEAALAAEKAKKDGKGAKGKKANKAKVEEDEDYEADADELDDAEDTEASLNVEDDDEDQEDVAIAKVRSDLTSWFSDFRKENRAKKPERRVVTLDDK